MGRALQLVMYANANKGKGSAFSIDDFLPPSVVRERLALKMERPDNWEASRDAAKRYAESFN